MSDSLKRIKEEIAIIQAQYKRETDKFITQIMKKYPEYFAMKIKEVQTVNRSSITNTTRTLICGSVVRGESLEQIAKDTHRPIKVIERVLGECRQSGMYKKVEDYVKGVY